MNIYMTSWHRLQMTIETLSILKARTKTPYNLTILDNGSNIVTKSMLFELHKKDYIANIVFMKENTGCLYNKFVYHSMTVSDEQYYIITDNDVLPPDLKTCWLKQMIDIMDEHQELAILALQLPPQQFQQPYSASKDKKVIYCKAVGNTFKLCRRSVLERVLNSIEQHKGIYGDDSLVCLKAHELGYKIGFTADLWCLHIGQCENWGYNEDEIKLDPRKVGYGKPFKYEYDPKTFEPLDNKYKINIENRLNNDNIAQNNSNDPAT